MPHVPVPHQSTSRKSDDADSINFSPPPEQTRRIKHYWHLTVRKRLAPGGPFICSEIQGVKAL
jgi:hypothetical protein